MSQGSTAKQTRPFSLWLYLLIVCGLSWPFQLASVTWGKDLLSVYVLNATSMVMVTVGTFLCGRFIFRDGFAGAGWKWGKPWHYAIVIGFARALASAKQTGQPIGRTIALVLGMLLLLGFVGGVLHGVIFAYIWMRGRSLVVSSVYRAAYDGLRDSVALTIGLGPLTSGWPALIIVLLGAVLLWRGNWKRLLTITTPTTPSPEVLAVEV